MNMQEIKNTAEEKLQTTEKMLAGMPRWRLALYGVLLLFVLVYLAWSVFHKKAAPAQVFTAAPAAVKVSKVAGPVMEKPLRVVPKLTVVKKFPEYHEADAPQDEVIDTADIPSAPNGVTTITKIDTETGEASTVYEPKKAPWFAFQDGNEVGMGYGITTHGKQTAELHYRRDICRVKDVYLSGEIRGTAPIGDPSTSIEGRATVQLNYRW